MCVSLYTHIQKKKKEKALNRASDVKSTIYEQVWVRDASVPKRHRIMKLWRAGKYWYYFVIAY